MVFALLSAASAQEIVNGESQVLIQLPLDSLTEQQLNDSLCHAKTSAEIEALLYAGANPNADSHDWGSPLCNAVEKEIQRGTQLLIDFGAQDLSKALRYAPNGDFVDFLVKNGADVNWACEDGTALNAWAMANYSACEALLKNGADPNSIDSINGTTPLCDTWDPEIALLLIKNGANVNFQAQTGNCIGATPLHMAIDFYRYEVARVLLYPDPNNRKITRENFNKMVNPFIKDNNGLMPIDNVPKGHRPFRRTLKRYMRRYKACAKQFQ